MAGAHHAREVRRAERDKASDFGLSGKKHQMTKQLCPNHTVGLANGREGQQEHDPGEREHEVGPVSY